MSNDFVKLTFYVTKEPNTLLYTLEVMVHNLKVFVCVCVCYLLVDAAGVDVDGGVADVVHIYNNVLHEVRVGAGARTRPLCNPGPV